MPFSLNIPNGIRQVGSQTFGPAALADADSVMRVTLDRTSNGGLNATPAAHVAALFQQQIPGDTTWYTVGTATFDGGIRTDPEMGQLDTDYLEVTLIYPGSPNRAVQCVLTVSGAPVRLSGSVTVS